MPVQQVGCGDVGICLGFESDIFCSLYCDLTSVRSLLLAGTCFS
jgi:hypothetical protein